MREDVRQALTIDRGAPLEQRLIDITTTGRKTGEARRIEIVFYRLEDAVYLSGIPAPQPRHWLLNLEAQPAFTFHLKGAVVADLPAVATVITDPAERRRILERFVDEFNVRNDGTWPEAVLDEWMAGSPLARVDFPEHAPAPQGAAQWDARYEEKASMWSGRPNGRLVAEVSELVPGRALDVGCGEGADAIWLAYQGWTVTGIDISAVAIERAKEAARAAAVVVDFVAGDAMTASLPSGAFDLVSLQYPALPKAAGEGAVSALLDLVSPGGVFLAVYHDLDDEHRAKMKDNGHDPDQYVWIDDLARLLGPSFEIEKRSVEDRIDPPEGSPHIADVILRARRV